MRGLYKKQKRILDKWYEEHKKEIGLFVQIKNLNSFPLGLLKELEKINDHETIIQNINNYLSSLVSKNIDKILE